MSHRIQLQPQDALLIVDPQLDFFPGGALGVPEGDAIIPILNQWLLAAKQANIPVIVSRDWHPPSHSSFEAQGGPWPPHCIQQTEGAKFHPQLQLPSNALVIDKAFTPTSDAYSAFAGRNQDQKTLADKLHALNVKRLWVGGLALDYCVQYTALDACKAGFVTHVILPACRAVADASGKAALQAMKAQGVILETAGAF